MKAQQLIQAVREEKAKNWKNSDFPEEWEQALEIIADHFESCEICCFDFDSWADEVDTLQEVFTGVDPSILENWICKN